MIKTLSCLSPPRGDVPGWSVIDTAVVLGTYGSYMNLIRNACRGFEPRTSIEKINYFVDIVFQPTCCVLKWERASLPPPSAQSRIIVFWSENTHSAAGSTGPGQQSCLEIWGKRSRPADRARSTIEESAAASPLPLIVMLTARYERQNTNRLVRQTFPHLWTWQVHAILFRHWETFLHFSCLQLCCREIIVYNKPRNNK